jgi:fibronectin-binding autotransporter adhesin
VVLGRIESADADLSRDGRHHGGERAHARSAAEPARGAGATLDLANLNNTVGSLAGGGTVTLGSAIFTLNSGSGQDFSGTISGSGGLVKSGTGTQTLSGSNSYTGSTVINGGILAVTTLANGGANSSIGASSAAAASLVLNGGTLQYTGTGGSTNRQFTLGTNGGALDSSGTGAINFTSAAPISLAGTGNRTLTLTGTSTADNTLAARIDNPSSGTTSARDCMRGRCSVNTNSPPLKSAPGRESRNATCNGKTCSP